MAPKNQVGSCKKRLYLTFQNWKNFFEKLLKQLYGPFFVDGVQLPQGYRSTTKRQLTFYHLVPRSKAESTLEPPIGFEHRTPGLGIQYFNHKPGILLFLKLPPRKLEPWFVLWSFFPLRLFFLEIYHMTMHGILLLRLGWYP